MNADGPQADRSADGPQLGDLLSMGLTIALCVALGFVLGWLVDLPLGTFPLCALIGLGLGIVAAVLFVARLFRRYL